MFLSRIVVAVLVAGSSQFVYADWLFVESNSAARQATPITKKSSLKPLVVPNAATKQGEVVSATSAEAVAAAVRTENQEEDARRAFFLFNSASTQHQTQLNVVLPPPPSTGQSNSGGLTPKK